jgi:ABC-type dipeptide/oligopeptide/nickel transport system ATPase subunit
MTGQILGGSSPSQAAAYQLMIYFAIAASRTLTAIFLAFIIIARMFDLRRQALVPWRWIPGLMTSEKTGGTRGMNNRFAHPPPHSKFSLIEQASPKDKTLLPPLLRVQQLTVESTNLFVPLLEVHAGDRIGISGRSGIGKSQLLRALARLDPLSSDHRPINAGSTITFLGNSFNDIDPAEWRSKVMWVSQDRPTISGTPRDFYEEVSSYRSRHLSKMIENGEEEHLQQPLITPMEIAREWNLPAKTWDQPWNAVSGGEAQRLSLAIALSLRPKLLLLDEPTSSCDVDTTSKIEMSLVEMNATIVMVSHSEKQLQRLCPKMVLLSSSIA